MMVFVGMFDMIGLQIQGLKKIDPCIVGIDITKK